MSAPTYARPDLDVYDGGDVVMCRNCPDRVIRNYDGRGTGWSHMYDAPLENHDGTKQCRPTWEESV